MRYNENHWPSSGKRRDTIAVKMGEADSHQPTMSTISIVLLLLVVVVVAVTKTMPTKRIHSGIKLCQ
jgi:hypothetical protein